MANVSTKIVLQKLQKAIEAEQSGGQQRFHVIRSTGMPAGFESPCVLLRKVQVNETRDGDRTVHCELEVEAIILRKNNAGEVVTLGDELEDDITAVNRAFEKGLNEKIADAVAGQRTVVKVTPKGNVENVIAELAEYADAILPYTLEYDRPYGG